MRSNKHGKEPMDFTHGRKVCAMILTAQQWWQIWLFFLNASFPLKVAILVIVLGIVLYLCLKVLHLCLKDVRGLLKDRRAYLQARKGRPSHRSVHHKNEDESMVRRRRQV